MEKSRTYSGLFIITPEKQDEIDGVKKSISSIIGENAGKVEKENMIGKKTLAYPVKKKDEGIYYEVAFTASPESVSGMMREFRINTDILRVLIEREK